MKTPRLGLIVAVGLVGLVYSGSALAAFSPKLTVSAGGPTVSIKAAEQNPSDDAIAKLEIYVPNGFALKSPVGGTVVGSVSGQALVKDIDPAAEHGYAATSLRSARATRPSPTRTRIATTQPTRPRG